MPDPKSLPETPPGPPRWRNKAHEGARRKGWAACRAGVEFLKAGGAHSMFLSHDLENMRDELNVDNPYMDRRTSTGHVTFSRSFSRAWRLGWLEAYQAANPHEQVF